MFLVLFLVGFVGFVAMVFLGAAHGGHGGHGHAIHGGHGHALGGHGHAGHAPGAHALPGAHAHGAAQNAPAPAAGHTPAQTQDASLAPATRGFNPMVAISPLDIFSYCLGGGATGVLLQRYLAGTPLIVCAIVGAIVFDWGVIKPLMALLMRFVSKPAEGLEGSVAHPAEAITGFDAQGRGIVRVQLDGQNVQLLAELDSLDMERGAKVHKGETLLVVEVDPRRNTCRVIKESA